jgi:hypothetical protein
MITPPSPGPSSCASGADVPPLRDARLGDTRSASGVRPPSDAFGTFCQLKVGGVAFCKRFSLFGRIFSRKANLPRSPRWRPPQAASGESGRPDCESAPSEPHKFAKFVREEKWKSAPYLRPDKRPGTGDSVSFNSSAVITFWVNF